MTPFKSKRIFTSLSNSLKSFINISVWQVEHKLNCKNMSSTSEKIQAKRPLKRGYMTIGEFNVFPWSISGIETSVVVKNPSDGFSCCFDMGHASRESVNCDTVLISHGHMDHVSAVPQHAHRRELKDARPASYYVPKHLVTSLSKIFTSFKELNENGSKCEPNICGCGPGDEIKLSKGYHAVPFETVHRVPSQGYIVYKRRKTLHPHLKDLPGNEISAKVKAGEDTHTITETPEVAFTGDTTFEVFTSAANTPPADLFKVKLLIMEATYIDNDEKNVTAAHKWGHIHLSELYQNASLFRDVGSILLIHFSDKYSTKYIEEKVYENIPEELKNKVFVATLAKDNYI